MDNLECLLGQLGSVFIAGCGRNGKRMNGKTKAHQGETAGGALRLTVRQGASGKCERRQRQQKTDRQRQTNRRADRQGGREGGRQAGRQADREKREISQPRNSSATK